MIYPPDCQELDTDLIWYSVYSNGYREPSHSFSETHPRRSGDQEPCEPPGDGIWPLTSLKMSGGTNRLAAR